MLSEAGDSPQHTITNGNDEPIKNSLPVQPPEPPPPRIPADLPSPDVDGDLRLALELSEREMKEAETRRRQEEEELEKILQLSLTEKWWDGKVFLDVLWIDYYFDISWHKMFMLLFILKSKSGSLY